MVARTLSKPEIEARSAFRHQLRQFERSSEDAAKDSGVTFAQYLLLLHVKGMPGRSWALVGELAGRMLLEHHSVVGLVSRCEAAGLVKRRRSTEDARQVEVHLTAKGEKVMNAVAAGQTDGLKGLLKFLQDAAKAAKS